MKTIKVFIKNIVGSSVWDTASNFSVWGYVRESAMHSVRKFVMNSVNNSVKDSISIFTENKLK